MTLDNALETLQVAIERLAQLAEDDGDSSLARRAENALQAVHETLRYAIILPSLKEMEEILNLSLDEWARFWISRRNLLDPPIAGIGVARLR